MSNLGPYIALAINYVLVLISLYYLYKSPVSSLSKVVWSIALLLPLIGLVFFWFTYGAPPPLPGHKRQGVNHHIAHGAKENMDRDHGVK